MSQNFLQKVVQNCIAKFNDFENVVFVIPNKRAIVFIKEELKTLNFKGVLPQFFTIEEWKEFLAKKQCISGISLWIEAYKCYTEIAEEESFDSFLKWIPTTLKDFDDIDMFTENHKDFFQYMISKERIDNWNLDIVPENSLIEKNLLFWERLHFLYEKLHHYLEEKNLATQGRINRLAIENTEDFCKKNNNLQLVCIGFNAFNPKEEQLLQLFKVNEKLHFFWDADFYYLNDIAQESGVFLRRNFSIFNQNINEVSFVEDNFLQPKTMESYACTQQVSQAKTLATLLKNISDEELQQTAIVLCDESLLSLVLQSLPQNVKNVNVTMGFPLKQTKIALLLQHFFLLKIEAEKHNNTFYFKNITELFTTITPKNHQEKQKIDAFLQQIQTEFQAYFSSKFFQNFFKNCSFSFLFDDDENIIDFLLKLRDYCIIISEIELLPIVQKEIALRYSEIITQCYNTLQNNDLILSWETLQQIVLQLSRSETLDFIGEPLRGLQILGLLETRLLSFKNVIMLSVNEGIIPLGRTENSYIPYDIKRQFQINTFAENDAIYAYHFYRLLQNANHISFVYNAYSDGLASGEKSRFLQQIAWETNHTIIEKNAMMVSAFAKESAMEIVKSEKVIEQLNHWKSSCIYPSHLTQYVYNPIDFYVSKILKIKEEDEPEEEISQQTYGNIAHQALQSIYEKFIGKVITEKEFVLYASNYKQEIENAIIENSHLKLFDKGYNYLQRRVMEKSVEKMLNYDLQLIKDGNSLEILSLEKQFSTQYETKFGTIQFGGFIDRIDKLNNQIRVIDYKSGKLKTTILNYEKQGRSEANFEKFTKEDTMNQALQLCLYAFIVLNEKMFDAVSCGIWSMKKPNVGVHLLQIDKEEIITLKNLKNPLLQIEDLIQEILSPEISFLEKSLV